MLLQNSTVDTLIDAQSRIVESLSCSSASRALAVCKTDLVPVDPIGNQREMSIAILAAVCNNSKSTLPRMLTRRLSQEHNIRLRNRGDPDRDSRDLPIGTRSGGSRTQTCKSIIFAYEACFYVNGEVNNWRLWSDTNPNWTDASKMQGTEHGAMIYSTKIHDLHQLHGRIMEYAVQIAPVTILKCPPTNGSVVRACAVLKRVAILSISCSPEYRRYRMR
ncbi:hypothetical protein PR048_016887 [Dryococelus australis]|uniref:Uncharacterized protein n=1 Tax=Dryococelus australis TaxID=614101 RepID=A0ABQ9H8I6_9NEOP|nr:hypothetical protein PR048_016887 [Dryococelus australis]